MVDSVDGQYLTGTKMTVILRHHCIYYLHFLSGEILKSFPVLLSCCILL